MTEQNPQESPQPQQDTAEYLQVRQEVVKPIVTRWLMGITVFIFALQTISGYVTGYDFPFIFGGKINELILQGEVWRLLSPILLHGSIFHLAINMYALYSLGSALEPHYGHTRFILLYLCGGFAGNVLSFVFSINPSLGSSTAIFGLLGAEGILILLNKKFFGKNFKTLILNTGGIALANLIIGLSTPRIDNWGHLGGLLGGIVFSYLAGPIWQARGFESYVEISDGQKSQKKWIGLGAVLLVFSLVALYRFFV
jgi:rhomboid protease GluP